MTTPALIHGDFVYRDGPAEVFVAAEGVALRDRDGRRILDAEAANGSVGLGYDASLLDAAARRVARMPALPSFCESDLRIQLAEELVAWFEIQLGVRGRVAFDLGGGQGLELALKIARRAARGNTVAVMEGGYHGRSPYLVNLSASARYRKDRIAPGVPVVRLPKPDCSACRFGQRPDRCGVECAAYVEQSLDQEYAGWVEASGDSDVYAFVYEPVLNVGGMAFPDSRYLRRTADAFRRRGAVIICDEVFTGFHRTGPGLATVTHGVVPDIVVVSKGLTNGLAAMSCVWAAGDIASEARFPPGTHSVTYANNPLQLAVAQTVLHRYRDWNSVEADVTRLGAELAERLQPLADSPLCHAVETRGGLARIKLTGAHAPAIRAAARQAGAPSPVDGFDGLLVASTGMSPDVVALHPPLTITSRDLDALAQLMLISFKRAEMTTRAPTSQEQAGHGL